MPLSRDWWARGGQPILKGEANVETSDLAALNVTSEKLSANALRRSLVISLPAAPFVTTTAAQLLSSSFVAFTPRLPITIAQLALTPMSSWTQTSVQTTAGLTGYGYGTLFAGNNIVGTVALPTSSGPPQGIQLAFATPLTNVSVPAGTALTFALPSASSSGMVQPQHFLTIDYDSTG